MKSFELLLTVLFIIIIYLTVGQNMESNIVVGVTSLFFVILWIGWDNMGAWDYNEPVNDIFKTLGLKPNKSPKRQKIGQKIKNKKQYDSFNNDPAVTTPDDSKESGITTKKVLHDQINDKDKPKNIVMKPLSSRPKSLEYSENNYKKNIFDEIGCLGDNRIAHLMKHISNKNRVAIDNMSRQNKFTNINYFAQELKDHANSRWWDDEKLEKEF